VDAEIAAHADEANISAARSVRLIMISLKELQRDEIDRAVGLPTILLVLRGWIGKYGLSRVVRLTDERYNDTAK